MLFIVHLFNMRIHDLFLLKGAWCLYFPNKNGDTSTFVYFILNFCLDGRRWLVITGEKDFFSLHLFIWQFNEKIEKKKEERKKKKEYLTNSHNFVFLEWYFKLLEKKFYYQRNYAENHQANKLSTDIIKNAPGVKD